MWKAKFATPNRPGAIGRNRGHDAAQFSKAPQPANGAIAWRDLFAEIIQHAMTVIGAHDDALMRGTAAVFLHERPQDGHHIHIAVEVIRLVK